MGACHRDLDGPREHHAGRLGLLGEILAQVVRHRGELIGRDRHAVVRHHAHHGAPALGRVAAAEAREERMAAVALGGHELLALALGQLLAACRERRREQDRREQQRTRVSGHGALFHGWPGRPGNSRNARITCQSCWRV